MYVRKRKEDMFLDTFVYPSRYFSFSRPMLSRIALAMVRSCFSLSLGLLMGTAIIASRTPSTLRTPYLVRVSKPNYCTHPKIHLDCRKRIMYSAVSNNRTVLNQHIGRKNVEKQVEKSIWVDREFLKFIFLCCKVFLSCQVFQVVLRSL